MKSYPEYIPIILIGIFLGLATYFGAEWSSSFDDGKRLSAQVSLIKKQIASASKDQTSTQTPAPTGNFIIYYDNFGFMPNIATVPSGTLVGIKNITNEGGMVLIQDPGQTTSNPQLNTSTISIGETKYIKLTNRGTWVYENSWEPTDKGQITVQ